MKEVLLIFFFCGACVYFGYYLGRLHECITWKKRLGHFDEEGK